MSATMETRRRAAVFTAPCDASDHPDLLTADGLAKFLGLSRDTIDRRRDELPPPCRIGRRLFWSRRAVMEHIERRNRG